MYKTTNARTSHKTPAAFVDKTALEIVAYMRENFKTEYDLDRGIDLPSNPETVFFMELGTVYFDPKDWRNAFAAYYPADVDGYDLTQAVAAVAQWYHGAAINHEIRVSAYYSVYSPGYQCW